jgi:hypothetical protein
MIFNELANPALQTALSKIRMLSYPVRTTYQLREFLNAFAAEVKKYEELYAVILEKHAKKDEAGNKISTDGGKSYQLTDSAAFLADLNELHSLESSALPVLNTLKISMVLESKEAQDGSLNLSLPELNCLENLIDSEGKTTKSPKAVETAAAEGEAKPAKKTKKAANS